MSSSAAEPAHSTTPDQAMPAVTFDIGLGKALDGKVVNFDFENYSNYLRSHGLDEKQIADTSVEFHNPRLTRAGDYGDGNINVYGLKRANESLLHETQHRIDHAQGTFGENGPSTRGADLALKLGMIAATLGVTEETISYLSHNQSSVRDWTVVMALGALCAGVGVVKYALNPAEKSARQAAKVPDRFVTVGDR